MQDLKNLKLMMLIKNKNMLDCFERFYHIIEFQ